MLTDRIENPMVRDELWHEPEPVIECTDCGRGIYTEEYYFDFGRDIICEDCIRDYMDSNFRREARS